MAHRELHQLTNSPLKDGKYNKNAAMEKECPNHRLKGPDKVLIKVSPVSLDKLSNRSESDPISGGSLPH